MISIKLDRRQIFSYLALFVTACLLVNAKKTDRLKSVLDAVIKYYSLNKE